MMFAGFALETSEVSQTSEVLVASGRGRET